jgi:hypothetical protein
VFGDAHGFPWRDQWFISDVLHSGARYLAWVLALVLAVGIWRPLPFARGLSRTDRIAWVAATAACALLIPLLKLASLTSCPWSLAEFGGSALHVSHWALGQADGGPGRLLSRRPCHRGVLLPAGLARPARKRARRGPALADRHPRRRRAADDGAGGARRPLRQPFALDRLVLRRARRGRSACDARLAQPSRSDRVKAAPLSLEFARARPAHGVFRAALQRVWAAPRSAQTIVLVLAAWLVLVGNLALWRSVFALESGRGGCWPASASPCCCSPRWRCCSRPPPGGAG